MKKVAMIRVGIDSGCGGIQGPIFRDGTFEYIPIPDNFDIDERTYENTRGRSGEKLISYFPEPLRSRMASRSIHFDPEFRTYTYGDPTSPKALLRTLSRGDMMVLYCGLEGWEVESEPALYIMGYFEIEVAGLASQFSRTDLDQYFRENFHFRHPDVFKRQKHDLVLVKGTQKSRLLQHAVKMSTMGKDRNGKPLKVLSPKMQKIFGDFDGKICFQRSPTRWVHQRYIESAIEFVQSQK